MLTVDLFFFSFVPTFCLIEIKKMQQNSHNQLEKILKDHQEMNKQIELQSKMLVQHQKELEKREAHNENERRKLDYEKEMVLQFSSL